MSLNSLFGVFLVVPVILARLPGIMSQTPTYAERLGWPLGTKAVILHVDDAGRSHGSNMGAIKAIEEGIATSAKN